MWTGSRSSKAFVILLLSATALFGQNHKITWETITLSKNTLFHPHGGGKATFKFKEPYGRTPTCRIKVGNAQLIVFPYEVRFTGPPGEKVTFECVEGPKN